MAIGKKFTYKVHEVDASTLVLDGLMITEFSHDGTFSATATAVFKNDFAATDYDAFRVEISYPNGSVPANSKTMTAMLQDCSLAIRTKFGNSEVVSL